MELGPKVDLNISPRLEVGPRLSVEVRVAIDLRLLELRLELIHSVYGDNYQPYAECPRCRRTMNPLEIIRGFRPDPNDFTTMCTGCGHRFQPQLRCSNQYSSITIPFFCSIQTLERLRGKDWMGPNEFRRTEQALYHSARIHHGGLRQAFEKIGIQYAFEEVPGWEERVQQFLGVLPDTTIASCIDVPVRAVRRLRRQLQIQPARIRTLVNA